MKIKIGGYSASEGAREFEILSREEVEDIIDDLSTGDVFRATFERANGMSHSGVAYTYVDARNGEIRTTWLGQGTQNHPWDDFYEVVVCRLTTGAGALDLDNPDDILYSVDECAVWEEFGGSLEGFLGTEEYRRRMEVVVGWECDEFALDHDDISRQLDELYRRE